MDNPRWRGMQRQVMSMSLAVLTLLHVVTAQYALALGGAPYEGPARHCENDYECDVEAGEGCFWLYDGCSKGMCMCDPKHHRKDPVSGQCKPLKLGMEACYSGDMCPEGMDCREGFCQCRHGRMTPDNLKCLGERQKLLGEECGRSSVCVQRATYGYTEQEVHCSIYRECTCKEGFKPDGVSCRKWRLYEIGCTRAYHCEGGAVCVNSRCTCPTNYIAVAGNTRCAKRSAVYGLPMGARCNSMEEKRYCARNLVCHQCATDSEHRCVRFLITNDKLYQLSSGLRVRQNVSLLVVLTIAGSLLAIHR